MKNSKRSKELNLSKVSKLYGVMHYKIRVVGNHKRKFGMMRGGK